MVRHIVVNDLMQQGYPYTITEPEGENFHLRNGDSRMLSRIGGNKPMTNRKSHEATRKNRRGLLFLLAVMPVAGVICAWWPEPSTSSVSRS